LTVNGFPLLTTPFTVTTTFPVVAPEGTDVAMFVALQLVTAATVPLKVTVPLDPKLAPVIVTGLPTDPDAEDRLEINGSRPYASTAVEVPT
jgi:hypothetical protein